MFSFLFPKKIDTELLKLSQITYGGEFYYNLKNYTQKDLVLDNTQFKKINDNLLKKIGNNNFFSYKNENSGFVANLFENIKNKNLVIAYRGTERIGLGENVSDLIALGKDVNTDINIILSKYDEQYKDAYDFYNLVKEQNPKSKITIIGQSLGGALAQLVSAKIYSATNKKLNTYTYNAPGCKHLLEVFSCNKNLDYSFITNYAVMNDWCGMFGEKIGETYLIPPIPPQKLEKSLMPDILMNVLLSSHEGIFEYSGKIIKKPKNFNQNEGLSLWYFDENNPIKEFETPSAFITSVMPSMNIPQMNIPQMDFLNAIQSKTEEFFKEQNNKFQEISSQIQTATLEFFNTHKDKLPESIANNTINQVSQFFDYTFSQITKDTLKNALSILIELKIDKTNPDYFNSFKKYMD